MFFIVTYHFIIQVGGNLINSTNGNFNSLIILINFLIIVHVNSFILVTGYFQYKKKFNLKSFLSLLFMIYFYKVAIAIIFMIFNLSQYDSIDLYKAFSPLEWDNYWFLKIYCILYILSPFINILIKNLNQKDHKKLLIILFVIFSVIPTLTTQRTVSNIGFSIEHFIFIYLIGSYFAKYPLKNNIHFKNYSSKKTIIILLTSYVFIGVVRFLLYEFCSKILIYKDETILSELNRIVTFNIHNYHTPLLIIQSICYFLAFEALIFKSKIINTISSSILAVYLITDNYVVRDNIYKWLGIKKDIILYSNIIPRVLLYIILIMIICILIEIIRKFLEYIIIYIYKKIRKRKNKTYV